MKKKVLPLIAATVLGTSIYGTSAMATNTNVESGVKAASAQIAASTTTTYKVQAGDTLFSLAKRYGMTVTQLKSLNGLTSNTIKVGQILKVSGKATTLAPSTTTTYKVRAGDTLFSIAKRYSMTVTQLKSLNGLTSDMIKVGQVLKVSGKAITSSPSGDFILDTNKLIQDAKALIGTPYRWGGNTPSGFDCSGFIYYVINKQKSIPRLTVAGYWNMMKPVSAPSVGDFVYYETYKSGPSHMGIYIGNGKFIQASSSQGVQITDMNNSYWKARYLGAREL